MGASISLYIASWSELDTALSQIYASGTSLTLNFTQAFALRDPAYNITLPSTISECTINGFNSSTAYNARITTNRNTYFKLVINNLNLEVPDDNPTIDIAKPKFSIVPYYNDLVINGTCIVNNTFADYLTETNVCGIYIDSGTGLNIQVNSGGTLDVKGVRSYSAPIGGKAGSGSGSIFISGDGTINITTETSCACALIGGGGSEASSGGNSEEIDISGNVTVNLINPANTFIYGALIGGGGSQDGNGGYSDIISIYGNSNVNISNYAIVFGAFIGGGGNFQNGQGGTSDSINIYGSSNVNLKNDSTASIAIMCGAGIGGGGSYLGNGGSTNSIKIYEDASVSVVNEGAPGWQGDFMGALIGSGGFYMNVRGTAGDAGVIEILDNADVNLSSNFILYGSGLGCGGLIGSGGPADITVNTTGVVDISIVQIVPDVLPDTAIGGGDSTINLISGLNQIVGGIVGKTIAIKNQFLNLASLKYSTLVLSESAVVVQDDTHTPTPSDRGDYYVIKLLQADGVTPYTGTVKLQGDIEDYVDPLTITYITPNADGTIRIYMSSGMYYFASSDNNFKTEYFSVNSRTPHDPNLNLIMLESTLARVSGVVWIDNARDGIYNVGDYGQAGTIVSLMDSTTYATTNSDITDSEGSFLISDVAAGSYYIVVNNIPLDYIFEVINSSPVKNTGVSKTIYSITGTQEVRNINIPIVFNNGFIGPKGQPGNNYTSSNINMLNLNLVTVENAAAIDLGNVAEGIGIDIYYYPMIKALVLNAPGSYMINFSGNIHFQGNSANNMNYTALQVMIGNQVIPQGFSYMTEEGIISGNLLVDTSQYIANTIQIVNVSEHDIIIDNFKTTVSRMQ